MPFSGQGPKRQISSKGGSRGPMWRKDGKAVIYSTDDGNLLEVEISIRNSELSVGAPRILFRSSPEIILEAGRTFDIAPDGRFMVDVRSQENVAQIVVISNWTAGLKN
jgi:hypothetical protein